MKHILHHLGVTHESNGRTDRRTDILLLLMVMMIMMMKMMRCCVAGNFPCLRAYFHLERRLRAYILTTYLPSFLVVLLSWLSFWIDLESAPARTSLSILTILTITTQSSGLLRSMPAGSFTKAIDVWMATCLVFVFGAFIEYSIVNTLARRQKAKSSREGTTISGLLSATTAAAAPLQPTATSSAALTLGTKTQRVRRTNLNPKPACCSGFKECCFNSYRVSVKCAVWQNFIDTAV